MKALQSCVNSLGAMIATAKHKCFDFVRDNSRKLLSWVTQDPHVTSEAPQNSTHPWTFSRVITSDLVKHSHYEIQGLLQWLKRFHRQLDHSHSIGVGVRSMMYFSPRAVFLFGKIWLLLGAFQYLSEQNKSLWLLTGTTFLKPQVNGTDEALVGNFENSTLLLVEFADRDHAKQARNSSTTGEYGSKISSTSPRIKQNATFNTMPSTISVTHPSSAPLPPISTAYTSSFFVKQFMTTQSPLNPSCLRQCANHHRNKIYYLSNKEDPGAGLLDRIFIINTLLNLAGYFCARVYLPRPTFLLGRKHNANRTLDARMRWSEFGDFSLWNDRQLRSALIDWDDRFDINEYPEVETLYNETSEMVRTSPSPNHVIKHFEELEEYTIHQQRMTSNASKGDGFTWVIRSWYYNWHKMLADHLRTRQLPSYFTSLQGKFMEPTIFALNKTYSGCQYGKVDRASHLQRLQDKIVETIFQRATPFTSSSSSSSEPPVLVPPLLGYFHIRRQDAKNECDTSLSNIEAYLNCSLGDAVSVLTRINSLKRIVVLFSSDEQDKTYREGAIRLVERLQHRSSSINASVTALDLDHLIEVAIQNEVENGRIPAWRNNNFYVFQLVLTIGYNESLTRFHLEQRRRLACGGCTNVTAQLVESGVLDGNYAQPTLSHL